MNGYSWLDFIRCVRKQPIKTNTRGMMPLEAHWNAKTNEVKFFFDFFCVWPVCYSSVCNFIIYYFLIIVEEGKGSIRYFNFSLVWPPQNNSITLLTNLSLSLSLSSVSFIWRNEDGLRVLDYTKARHKQTQCVTLSGMLSFNRLTREANIFHCSVSPMFFFFFFIWNSCFFFFLQIWVLNQYLIKTMRIV